MVVKSKLPKLLELFVQCLFQLTQVEVLDFLMGLWVISAQTTNIGLKPLQTDRKTIVIRYVTFVLLSSICM
jgi:hypothetical protein